MPGTWLLLSVKTNFPPIDKKYLEFGKEFEERYIGQGQEENRSIIETLDLGWELLGRLPREELDRVDTKILDKYYKTDGGKLMMSVTVREYTDDDMDSMIAIWNEVIEEGIAFPSGGVSEQGNRSGLFRGTELLRRGGRRFRPDPGALYPASKQCRKMRPYMQCQLCGIVCEPGTSYRGKTGSRLHDTGPQDRISDSPV